MEYRWFLFITGLLSAWRVTHLLQAEDGPFDLIFKLRKALGKSFAGKLMDCFNCLSLWVSVPFALVIGGSWLEWILLWISFSGGAILLNHVTGDPGHVPPAKYFEDP